MKRGEEGELFQKPNPTRTPQNQTTPNKHPNHVPKEKTEPGGKRTERERSLSVRNDQKTPGMKMERWAEE